MKLNIRIITLSPSMSFMNVILAIIDTLFVAVKVEESNRKLGLRSSQLSVQLQEATSMHNAKVIMVMMVVMMIFVMILMVIMMMMMVMMIFMIIVPVQMWL